MSNNVVSPDEIERILAERGMIDAQPDPQSDAQPDLNVDHYLSHEAQDALGEIGNICMGTSATTLYMLLGRNVSITTPRLSIHTMQTLGKEYPAPIVVVEVQYTEGLNGINLLFMRDYDVALITDLLMGGDATAVSPDNVVLDEIQLSAIKEVMNQMVGSAATSLAAVLSVPVNISTPDARFITINGNEVSKNVSKDEILLKVAFQMVIEGVLTSEIMQVMPVEFAKRQVSALLGEQQTAGQNMNDMIYRQNEMQVDNILRQSGNASQPAPSQPYPQTPPSTQNVAPQYAPPPPQYAPQYAQPPVQYAQQPPYYAPPMDPSMNIRHPGDVDVQEVRYPALSQRSAPMLSENEIDHVGMLMNVPMNVTVQLGRSKRTIKEITEFDTGSIIVLEKMAGEYVEILVNGIEVAKGEVIVVDESYGVRITEINAPSINRNFKVK